MFYLRLNIHRLHSELEGIVECLCQASLGIVAQSAAVTVRVYRAIRIQVPAVLTFY